jgi:hypothetical protein
MAKLESGRAEWVTSEVDIGKWCAKAMDSLGQLFRDKGVALEATSRPAARWCWPTMIA